MLVNKLQIINLLIGNGKVIKLMIKTSFQRVIPNWFCSNKPLLKHGKWSTNLRLSKMIYPHLGNLSKLESKNSLELKESLRLRLWILKAKQDSFKLLVKWKPNFNQSFLGKLHSYYSKILKVMDLLENWTFLKLNSDQKKLLLITLLEVINLAYPLLSISPFLMVWLIKKILYTELKKDFKIHMR